MSRTLKTRPAFVRLFDDPPATVEVHDHRFGECDLPSRDTYARSTDPRWRCSYDYLWWYRGYSCGCRICTNFWGRRTERRRDRRAARRTYWGAD